MLVVGGGVVVKLLLFFTVRRLFGWFYRLMGDWLVSLSVG